MNKRDMVKPCHYCDGHYAPEQLKFCYEGTPKRDECIKLERGVCWMDCEYGGEWNHDTT